MKRLRGIMTAEKDRDRLKMWYFFCVVLFVYWARGCNRFCVVSARYENAREEVSYPILSNM